MVKPSKRTGYLTQQNWQQVTVTKMIHGKDLVAKSAQIGPTSQYEATFYEWDHYFAFSFKYDGKHCCPKVGNGLELGEYAEEDLPDSLGNENYFIWHNENKGEWRRLKNMRGTEEWFLYCGEDGKLFLNKGLQPPGQKVQHLFKIVYA